MKKILVLGLVGAFAAAPTFAETIADDETTEVEEVAIDSGAYIGLGLGGEFGSTKGYVSETSDNPDKSAVLYGDMYKKNSNKMFGVVSLGYNHVFGKFLAGIGGSYSFGEKKKSQVYIDNQNAEHNDGKGSHDADFRTESGNTPEAFLKLGMICCKKNLIYVKLGAAWPQTKYVDTDTTNNYVFDGKKNKAAFKVAIGYERAFTKNVSGFVEYAYTANSKKTYERAVKAADTYTYTAKFDHKQQGSHSFVVGASYSFSMN